MKKNIIRFKNLEVILAGKTILKDISFTLTQNEPLCVIGEGSSGKTTLLKSILGLVPISSGEIQINEFLLSKRNYSATRCSYLFRTCFFWYFLYVGFLSALSVLY